MRRSAACEPTVGRSAHPLGSTFVVTRHDDMQQVAPTRAPVLCSSAETWHSKVRTEMLDDWAISAFVQPVQTLSRIFARYG